MSHGGGTGRSGRYNSRYDGGEYAAYGSGAGGSKSAYGGGSGDFRAVAPPRFHGSSGGSGQRGYTGHSQISHAASMLPTYDQLIRKPRTEEDYWNEDDEEPPSSVAKSNQKKNANKDSSPDEDEDDNEDENSEVDPLDAFMADLKEEMKEQGKKGNAGVEKGKKGDKGSKDKDSKGIRDDIEMEDDEESYYRYINENPSAGASVDDDDLEIEYDEDGNPIAPQKSKWIDPLPALDHSTVQYRPFEKNFYIEHSDIRDLTFEEVNKLRQTLGIRVLGAMAVNPVASFAHMNLDGGLMKTIRKAQYEQPTPIQAQAIPLALNGRDIIGVAKTGSGKTLAFLVPLLVHLMDQPELKAGDGPIGLILAPTRELAMQIYTEAKKFAKVYNVNVACCFGGGSKWEQSKALTEGAEIVVATPGRMIDMIKMKATNLERVTFLVLDEADRMFDMGFEPQVRSICNHVRPDRQCLMFSATFKKRIEKLARDALTDPVKIIQGDIGEATEDVTQIMVFIKEKEQKDIDNKKFQWLADNLVGFCSQGSVLVFITRKANCEIVSEKLRLRDHKLGMLHGDIEQTERTKIIAAFKRQDFPILVATDVCARGLDITHIRTVVNFDMARDIDTHTHRIGRTGRAGQKGIAYSLVCEKDREFAGHLVRNLEGANQKVPGELMELAMQSQWFRKSRFSQSAGGGKQFEMRTRQRPGLGSSGHDDAASGAAVAGRSAADGDSTAASGLPQLGPLGSRITPAMTVNEALASQAGADRPMSRLSVMKAAYGAQYRSHFRAASDREDASRSTFFLQQERQPQHKASPAVASSKTTSGGDTSQRKRSRWQ